jgi:hypothetical protein
MTSSWSQWALLHEHDLHLKTPQIPTRDVNPTQATITKSRISHQKNGKDGKDPRPSGKAEKHNLTGVINGALTAK